MADPVVRAEYVAHVRHVTAELRELIPTVASVAGHARALLDADEFGAAHTDRVLAPPIADLADVAQLLSALLNLNEPLRRDVVVDLMDHLDRHARR
jgi:hypothetical protein